MLTMCVIAAIHEQTHAQNIDETLENAPLEEVIVTGACKNLENGQAMERLALSMGIRQKVLIAQAVNTMLPHHEYLARYCPAKMPGCTNNSDLYQFTFN